MRLRADLSLPPCRARQWLREGLGMERDSPKATSEFWSCKICVLEVNKLRDENSISLNI